MMVLLTKGPTLPEDRIVWKVTKILLCGKTVGV